MPSKLDHLGRAQQNEQFLRSFNIDKTPFRDWILVAAHLSALHYVQAVIESKGIFCKNHSARKNIIASDQDLTPISVEYHELYQHNKLARYDLVSYSPDDIRKTIFPLFDKIKNHVIALPMIKPHIVPVPASGSSVLWQRVKAFFKI